MPAIIITAARRPQHHFPTRLARLGCPATLPLPVFVASAPSHPRPIIPSTCLWPVDFVVARLCGGATSLEPPLLCKRHSCVPSPTQCCPAQASAPPSQTSLPCLEATQAQQASYSSLPLPAISFAAAGGHAFSTSHCFLRLQFSCMLSLHLCGWDHHQRSWMTLALSDKVPKLHAVAIMP